MFGMLTRIASACLFTIKSKFEAYPRDLRARHRRSGARHALSRSQFPGLGRQDAVRRSARSRCSWPAAKILDTFDIPE
jgi:hypothetical protein